MAYGTINADLMTTSDGVSSSGLYGFKNRIINGAMVIDQRNAGASVTPSSGQFTLDRWNATTVAGTSKFSVQQNAGSVTPPAGFINYLGITSLSAYSITAGDIQLITQAVEGLNVADLGWGTANASTVTLSFWVRSSLTGSFGGSLRNYDNNRSYPFSYTISSANTWTQISVTIAGDTSGTWYKNNSTGIYVSWGLGVGSTYSGTANTWGGALYGAPTGSVSVVGTNGATFYITGVQLEKGSTATSFDYRPYPVEFSMCQRYFISYGGDTVYNKGGFGGSAASGTGATNFVCFPVQMRATPSFSYTGSWAVSDGVAGTAVTSLATLSNQSSSLIGLLQITVASGLTTYRPYWLESNNSTASKLLWSAEL